MQTEHLIDQLTADLAPVKPLAQARLRDLFVGPPALISLYMLIVAVLVQKDTILAQAHLPRFYLPAMGMLLTMQASHYAAWCLRLPGSSLSKRTVYLLAAGPIVWLLGILSMHTWRVPISFLDKPTLSWACLLEVMLFAGPPLVWTSVLLRRGFVVAPRPASLCAALGATSCGALAVHLSCTTWSFAHEAVSHGLPILAVIVIASLFSRTIALKNEDSRTRLKNRNAH